MSGIVGSRLNIRGSGVVGKLGTDGQVFTSSGAGAGAVFEAAGGGAVSAINNATVNELVTIGSTTTELDSEANLIYNGTLLGCGADGANADLGVGIHIKVADSSATANANADELVIESSNSDNTGISILSDTDGTGQLVFGDSGDNDIGRVYYSHSSNYMALYTSGTERMRIKSAGDIDIAGGYTTSGDAGISFVASGEMNVSRAGTGDNEMARFANANGLVGTIKTNGTATAYNTSSDYRLKENQVAISDGIDRIKQLKPYRFNFKAEADKTMDGFFAHEVSGIIPEAISGEKDAMIPEVLYNEHDELPEGKNIGDVKEETKINPQGIDQAKLVPLLVAAVKELTAKVEALENA